jgi:hypothetical protein
VLKLRTDRLNNLRAGLELLPEHLVDRGLYLAINPASFEVVGGYLESLTKTLEPSTSSREFE